MGLLGSLLGTDQRSDITNSYNKSQKQLTSGYNTQQADYTQAANAYSPYVQTGQQANAFYANALGLNGTGAQQSAQDTITSNPLYSGKFALDSNNVLKSMNARGLGASGAGALAGQRVLTEDYNNDLQNYANLGNQGLQATGAQAGVYQGQGNNAYNYGATQAGNSINYGNSLAQNDNTGINNILGIVGTGVNALTAGSGLYNALYNGGGARTR